MSEPSDSLREQFGDIDVCSAIGHVRVISERGIRGLAVGYERGVKPEAGRLRVTPSRLRGGSADVDTPTALIKFSHCHRKVLNRRLTRRAE